ncbi:YkgJ family cysteine cluster protein [Xanthobacter sp. KR7-65]|uniref:YkgJ family cysteine cluster protein n=1 Tax=Xanthobacter sp. KR7-65 TaxID=3156612 RepID=UPI0032B602AF
MAVASHPSAETEGPAAFFRAQQAAFAATLGAHAATADLLDRIWMQAFSSYEHNVAEQAKDLPPLACRKGCGTCCAIQVAATAPEVMMVARYMRSMAQGFRKVGIDLAARLAATPAAEPGTSGTMALGRECPFVVDGICVIYPVRPLACRGHVSFDADACIAALEGEADDVPVSESHRTVRALVQGALQSALRDAGRPWALYDLVEALRLALARPDSEAAFAAGEDFLAGAVISHVTAAEMARTFDALKA